MPSRATLPLESRELVEGLLGAEELQLVRAYCEACCVPFFRWTLSPSLTRILAPVAVARLASQLEARGMGKLAAESRACGQLGLSSDTLSTWKKREQAAIRRVAKKGSN